MGIINGKESYLAEIARRTYFSRIERDKLEKQFGYEKLESILVHNRLDRVSDYSKLKIFGRRYEDTIRLNQKGTPFHTQGKGVRKGRGNTENKLGGLSSFSQNVGRLLVRFYCPPSGVVFDPFAGHNSRMEMCVKAGFSYIGVDVSKQFMQANQEVVSRFLKIKNCPSIELIEHSSENLKGLISDSAGDFTITSPPYWDLEYYGDEPEQLGNGKSYSDFLMGLELCVKENFRILKSGAFCCWIVNDFVKNKKFYAYHIDLYNIFLEAGFEPFSIYIIDLGQPLAGCFIQSIVKTKRFAKRHEYVLLFRKPAGKLKVREK